MKLRLFGLLTSLLLSMAAIGQTSIYDLQKPF